MQPPRSEREHFVAALARETAILQAQFPGLADSLGRAHAILAEGRLFVEESGREAMVQSSDFQQWYHVNGSCQCPASTYRQEPCKHRLALRLYQRVSDAMQADEEQWVPTDTAGDDSDSTGTPEASEAMPGIDPRYIVHIQGQAYVRYAGLLLLAHQRGLQALSATWTHNSDELSLATATATFPFGTYTECGDASPSSVNRKVAYHFRRCALTRAKARCLRDALGVDAVALEELGEMAP